MRNMAAVNACFVPDDGAAVATNGGAGHQRAVGSITTDAEGATCWAGNDTSFERTSNFH